MEHSQYFRQKSFLKESSSCFNFKKHFVQRKSSSQCISELLFVHFARSFCQKSVGEHIKSAIYTSVIAPGPIVVYTAVLVAFGVCAVLAGQRFVRVVHFRRQRSLLGLQGMNLIITNLCKKKVNHRLLNFSDFAKSMPI